MTFNKIEYLAGIFGFLQLSMKDVGLIGEHGKCTKKKQHMKPSEQDGIAIYDWVGEQIKHIEQHKLRKLAAVTDKRVGKLLNDHKVVNNFLLGLLLLRGYLDDLAPKNEQLMILPKVNRLIDVVDGAISDEEFNADIKRTTSRTADNLFRQAIGKCQIADDCRDARFKRIVK